jgi:hypothetical protein
VASRKKDIVKLQMQIQYCGQITSSVLQVRYFTGGMKERPKKENTMREVLSNMLHVSIRINRYLFNQIRL